MTTEDPDNPLDGRCTYSRFGHDFDGVECRHCGLPYDPELNPATTRDADHAGGCFDGCRHWQNPWEREAQLAGWNYKERET